MARRRVNSRQLEIIDRLREENRVLRKQLGGPRLRFTDDQRRHGGMQLSAAERVTASRTGPTTTRAHDAATRFPGVGLRSTFITLAIEDGADPDVIEARVAHSRKARNVLDGYNRGLQLGGNVRQDFEAPDHA